MDSTLAQGEMGRETLAGLRQLPRPAKSAATVPADRYDFSRAGDIAGPQKKVLDRVNGAFAGRLQHVFGGWLRTEIAVTQASSEQIAYPDFLRARDGRGYLFSLRVEPLGGRALIDLDMALVLPVVDLLLGGVGSTDLSRELTEIEEEILEAMMQRITGELNEAWRTSGLQFEDGQRESAELAVLARASRGSVVLIRFAMEIGNVRGELKLCLPVAGLNSWLREAAGETVRSERASAKTRLYPKTV